MIRCVRRQSVGPGYPLPRLRRGASKKEFSLIFPTQNPNTNMIFHKEISDTNLRNQIRKNKICLGGNENLKIYGTLLCKSGKRMKIENRVFFISEKEALDNGYRPCGNCLAKKYKQWKTDH